MAAATANSDRCNPRCCVLTLCRSRSRRRCSFVRAAPSKTARWKDEDEDEEQKKQKEREREKERELCTYMYMCSYVFVCTFPISHFLYPYSNTIGKMGEIGEKKSENQSRISAISLLMVYAWSAVQQVAQHISPTHCESCRARLKTQILARELL